MNYKLTNRGKITIYVLCILLVVSAIVLTAFINNKAFDDYYGANGTDDLTPSEQPQENNEPANTPDADTSSEGSTQSSQDNNGTDYTDTEGSASEASSPDPIIVEVTDNRDVMNNLKLSIFFGPNVTVLENNFIKALDLFAAAALTMEGAPIQIEGNCATTAVNPEDAVNSDLNYKLSLHRAEVVYDYLVQAGVEPDRLIIVANGSSKPMKDNSTAEGRKYNRRVDIFFRIVED
ncbi:MAG: OmpA family protein [Bacillota bacterium]